MTSPSAEETEIADATAIAENPVDRGISKQYAIDDATAVREDDTSTAEPANTSTLPTPVSAPCDARSPAGPSQAVVEDRPRSSDANGADQQDERYSSRPPYR